MLLVSKIDKAIKLRRKVYFKASHTKFGKYKYFTRNPVYYEFYNS